MSIHTWPEKDLIAFDLFCCRDISLEDVTGALNSFLTSKKSRVAIDVLDRRVHSARDA
jgi:S-adenosylmethionine/arginine decarboxylase-like enzyme